MPDVPGLSLHDILAQILTFADSEFDIPYAWMQIAANAILADERLLVALTHNTREGWESTVVSDPQSPMVVWFDDPGDDHAVRVRVVPVDD